MGVRLRLGVVVVVRAPGQVVRRLELQRLAWRAAPAAERAGAAVANLGNVTSRCWELMRLPSKAKDSPAVAWALKRRSPAAGRERAESSRLVTAATGDGGTSVRVVILRDSSRRRLLWTYWIRPRINEAAPSPRRALLEEAPIPSCASAASEFAAITVFVRS